MKKIALFVILLLGVLGVVAGVYWSDAKAKLKSEGYIAYTAEEAQELAYTKCAQCHNTDKIARYCMRCGPPLIVVVHNMKRLTELDMEAGKRLDNLTDAESVAIAQVWSALVGNWEHTFRKEDMEKLLEGDAALIKLANTPIKDRPIESALAGKAMPGVYKEDFSMPMAPKPE